MNDLRADGRRVPQRWLARACALLLLSIFLAAHGLADGFSVCEQHKSSPSYFPDRWHWEWKRPEAVGLDARALQRAIDFALAHEGTGGSKNIRQYIMRSFAQEPLNDIIGPVKDRGEPNGLVVRHGYIVAEWGDTERVDMTFSVTKSYLSTVAGLALDRGLIADVHHRVRKYVPDETFDSAHNRKITWHHLLTQTSEWEGTLWGKPDWADRWRGQMRQLHEPGTHWQYNDVRVNILAYALLQVWRKPLPQVLKAQVMDPIGASNTWRWYGYRNSFVTIDGLRMQSVSGGGHWGGGMWIHSRDQARFGYMYLRRGRWKDRQVLSERWIDMATTPTPVKPTYGYMWWLNTDRKLFPSAPASDFFALGAGTNMIWIDPEHDLVVVVRWIDRRAIDGFIQRLLAAVEREE
ncbi:MAG: class C beta-lactamase-related serine hydrolase [Acidobacteria bacterium]|nr:MAG: class C beta-lactamase-related serine hydrolase [Acidobacteriota bacterium]